MIDSRLVVAYEKHAADLMAYAAALVGPGEAEDLLSDAMIRVFATARWDRVLDERGYLFRCVLNEARRQGRRRAMASIRVQRAPIFQPDRAPDRADTPGPGRELFRRLSPRERAVVFLTYWEDAAIAEVANTLAISDGAVRRYLARARTKLREDLRDD